jgi:GT2 family glycosyltransferase
VFSVSIGLRALFPKSSAFDPRSYGRWQRDTVREVAIVTGCLFLIDREIWSDLGGFDREFFMYGEETDLCMRAVAHGARPIITPDATIIHYGGASEGLFEDKVVRLLDGEVRLFRRHWPPLYSWLAIRLTLFGVWLRAVGYSMLDRVRGNKNPSTWRKIWRRRAEWMRGSQSPSP